MKWFWYIAKGGNPYTVFKPAAGKALIRSWNQFIGLPLAFIKCETEEKHSDVSHTEKFGSFYKLFQCLDRYILPGV